MKCLAATQGPKIRVNAVLPGLLLTEWVCHPYSVPKKCLVNGWQGEKFGEERIKMVKERAVLKQEVGPNVT